MNSVLQLVFISGVFLVFYTYVGFPLLLKRLFVKKKDEQYPQENLPFVSIVISVFNEEKVIGQKLEGMLTTTYKGNWEILIGSDASTDRTNAILSDYSKKDSRIKVLFHQLRRGKPAMINDLISTAKGDILLLTDANVFFEPDTLPELIHKFNNPKVGLSGATILNSGIRRDGISHQEKSYIQRENLIKYREGEIWGTMMGPFGGCYAIRKELYEPVPAHFLVDDFYIAMVVMEKGFKCVNALDAICYEDVSNDIMQEYRRKARISAGNFQNLKRFRMFLFKPFSPVGFCFISHKVLRWLTPFFILVTLITLAFLQMQSELFLVLFIGQLLLMLTPFFDFILGKTGVHLKLLRFASYFMLMNLALLKGFLHYLSGVRSGVWTPTSRSVDR